MSAENHIRSAKKNLRSKIRQRETTKTSNSVMVFGTFDRLHSGHRDFFRQASQLGHVLAIVARDARVMMMKGRAPEQTERARLNAVKKNPHVKSATLGHPTNLLVPIQKCRPTILALGFDQKTFSLNALKSKLKALDLTPNIVRLKPYHPEKFKSSLRRNKE